MKAAAHLGRDSRLAALKAILDIRDDLDLNELRSIARELGHAKLCKPAGKANS